MYAKKNPEDFILLDPGLDLVQTVVLFFGSKATLHPGCPFLPEFCCYDLPVILMLTRPTFPFEVRCDLLAGTPLSVGIGSIDVVSRDMCDLAEQGAAVPD